MPATPSKTAFVFAGGSSLGAIQVGMLKALVAHGYAADLVVGSSVGAINAAYFAGDPSAAGVADCFPKPFPIDMLRRSVRRALEAAAEKRPRAARRVKVRSQS